MGWQDRAIPISQSEQAPAKTGASWMDRAVPIEAPAPQSVLDKKVMGMTPRGLIQGTLNTLPYVGAAGGGLIGGTAGTALGPAGTVSGGMGGAALGGATGGGLKNLGEEYILGQEKKPGDYIKAEGSGALHGAEQEIGGQVTSRAIKAVSEAPGMIKALAEVPTKDANAVYDPFLKMDRVPGQSIDELKNIRTAISSEPTLTQKAAGLVSDAIDKTKDVAGKTADVAGKVYPYAAELLGGLTGHLPGYTLGRAAASPAGKAALKAGGGLLKDAAGQVVADPQELGLVLRAAAEAKQQRN